VALVSITLVLNAGAYDAARWRAGTALVASGIPAGHVDAGAEWFLYHQTGKVHRGVAPGAFAAYDHLYGGTPICAVVSASRLRKATQLVPVGTTNYRLYGVVGPTRHLYRYLDPTIAGCR